MKKIISLLAAFTFAISASAFAQPLYSKETQEIVTGGVTHKNIQRFYGDYALNINVITADLKNENLSLELLKSSDGVDKKETVMNFASKEENVVAATNADFFSAYKGDQNFSLGIEVKDGKLLQSHIKQEMAAGIFKDNTLLFSYISFNARVTAPSGNNTALAHVNKPTDYYGALLMYTHDFNGGISPFLPVGITAVTVEDGKVSKKGISQGGTIPIPENGYILVINDTMTPFLEYNFNIGDEVGLSFEVSDDALMAKTAFGGGTLLLSGGKKTPITHNVSGNNPRTVIATSADGTVVYLITVDGRQKESRGVSLEELADICLELGCSNALNLDGGGSTAMVGKTIEKNNLHFFNSPTEQRKVINALAITSSAQSGETAGFLIEPEKKNVLSGDSVNLKITPYDENYNPPKNDNASPTFVISKGQGYVKDNVYYAKGGGETEIEVYKDGEKTDSCVINVIDEVSGIEAKKSLSVRAGESISSEGIAEIFDKNGNRARVKNIELLSPSYNKDFISISNGVLRVLKEGGGKITLSFGKAKRDIKIISGNFDADIEESVTDDVLNKEREEGFKFNVFGFKGASTLFDRIVYTKMMDISRKADAFAILGSKAISDLTPSSLSPLCAQSFKESDFDSAKIISLELSSDGVMQRGQQWKKLSEALNKAVQKNIFVILNSRADFLTDVDKEAFSSMLSKSAENKNVFVIYNGDENFCSIDKKVRYISIADVKDEKLLWKAIENTKYLSFNITGEEVTYSFKKIYN